MGKLRQLLSILFLTATILTTCALAQNNLTQIRDTIYNADGTPFNGTVVITWNGYSTTVSGTISPLSTSARIYNGALSVLLVPTTTAAAGSYYQIVYTSSDGTTRWTETWQVPPSANALSVAGVRTSTSTGTGNTGNGTGNGTGSTQYATLPIAMSQVTGLTAGFNTLTTNLAALTTTVSGNSSAISTLNTTVTNLSNTVAGLSSGAPNSTNALFVDSEVPSGAVNGTNTVFTLSAVPSPAGSLELYRNGLVQAIGIDYTISGNTITFLPAGVPHTADTVQAYYRAAGTTTPAALFSDSETPGGVINGTNTTFTLGSAPSPVASLRLYKNGMLLKQTADYTLSGSTVTFLTAVTPQSGDALVAYYRH